MERCRGKCPSIGNADKISTEESNVEVGSDSRGKVTCWTDSSISMRQGSTRPFLPLICLVSGCLHHISTDMTRHYDQGNLRKKSLFEAYGFRRLESMSIVEGVGGSR
jgi:hypothetical protein